MVPTNEVYVKAGEIARIAMGTDVIPGVRGKPREVVFRADNDPLAWWCLVELLINFRNWKPKNG